MYTQQGYSVGEASLHFFDQVEGVDDSGSYVSFEDAPETWKRLDGTSPPVKMYFKNQQYDEGARVFKGKISWGSNTFFGAAE